MRQRFAARSLGCEGCSRPFNMLYVSMLVNVGATASLRSFYWYRGLLGTPHVT
jgi:hypothetical protein